MLSVTEDHNDSENDMKTYELIIQQQQPSCGGKSPYRSEFRTVTTDDPVAYVRKLEPSCELEVTQEEDGVTVIRTVHNGAWIRYEFCEE